MIKYVLLLFVSIMLMSCANFTVPPLERSQFVLERALIVQTHFQNLYFQGGIPVRPLDVKQYEPFCSLNTTLESTPRSTVEVMADVFAIVKVGYDSPEGTAYTNSSGHKGGATFRTTLFLESELQPYVFSLRCQHWTVGTGKQHLRFTAIENIIGPVGKFIK